MLNIIQKFKINQYELVYIFCSIIKIKHNFNNLEEDIYMLLYSVKKLLNKDYNDISFFNNLYKDEFIKIFEAWLKKQKCYSFIMANSREINNMYNLIQNINIDNFATKSQSNMFDYNIKTVSKTDNLLGSKRDSIKTFKHKKELNLNTNNSNKSNANQILNSNLNCNNNDFIKNYYNFNLNIFEMSECLTNMTNNFKQ